ncbi:hypothetical protein H4Q26_015926 [Puccinia striiformis f. sp. tritici PST-130]|nr:hypothetical protein H4Q26_015926 [Puccinia striiformis f. sp. tritici PST-130]
MIKPRQTQDLVNSIASSSTDGQPSADGGKQTMATSFVDRLIDRYAKALMKQRITYFALLACYGLVIIFGVVGVIWDVIQEKRAARGNSDPPKILDEKKPKGDPTDDELKSGQATHGFLRYPPPPPSKYPFSSIPLPPPPPSFLEMNDEPPEPHSRNSRPSLPLQVQVHDGQHIDPKIESDPGTPSDSTETQPLDHICSSPFPHFLFCAIY